MSWNLSNDGPIYLQLIEQIKLQILSGRYACGEHFPSVRDLASDAAVNPNTMQKALAQLEQIGLLTGSRTSGRTVTTDQAMLHRMREELANSYYEDFLHSLAELGFSSEETKNFIIANCDTVVENTIFSENRENSSNTSQQLAEGGAYDSTTSERSE